MTKIEQLTARKEAEAMEMKALAVVKKVLGMDYYQADAFLIQCREGYLPTVKSAQLAKALIAAGLKAWNPKTNSNW